MTRNLLYTAVTRAKTLVVLVGQEEILQKFIQNANEQRRFSGLKARLMDYFR
jgi:exodeoxyribonuclease V alpha subunit